MSRGIVGRFFKQDVYMRDSRHAANNFGYNKSALNNGTPRHKFQYFVNFNFNSNGPEDALDAYIKDFGFDNPTGNVDRLTAMVKSVTMPNVSIESEVMNQYNRRRIVHTKLKPEPVTIMLHDTVEGRTLRFWEMYYEYYFKDGVATDKTKPDSALVDHGKFKNDIISNSYNNNFGYNTQRVGNNRDLLKSIQIFQVHGRKYSLTTLVNPRIVNFTHDTLDYAATSELMQVTMSIEYEAVVYSNVNEPLSSEMLERYRDGDFWQMANLITITNDVKSPRDLSAPSQLPELPDSQFFNPSEIVDNQNTSATPTTNFIQGEVNRSRSRVQQTAGAIVDSIPGAVSSVVSSSIFGGKVSFSPNPIRAVKSTANEAVRGAVFRGQEALSSRVTQSLRNIIDGVSEEDE